MPDVGGIGEVHKTRLHSSRTDFLLLGAKELIHYIVVRDELNFVQLFRKGPILILRNQDSVF